MADRPTQRAERTMDDTASQMERELEEVGEHVEEAKAKAPDARPDKKLASGGTAAGDVAEQEGGPMFGEDAEGAVDEDRE